MISFKDGVLKIQFDSKKHRNFYRHVFEISMYIGIVLYFIMVSPIHYFGVAAIFVGTFAILIEKLTNSRFNTLTHTAWYLFFIAIAELSTMWAFSPIASATTYTNFMFIILALCFGITQYVSTPADAERLLSIYALVAFTIALIEFVGTPYSLWFKGFFGNHVSKGNTNTFGYYLLFGSIIAFYKAYSKGQRLWYLSLIVTLAGCILSSSRKAAVMSLVGILLIVAFSFKKKHHFLHLFLIIALGATAFSIIMTNDSLYSVLGKRFTSLFEFMNDNTMSDGSLNKRSFYINYAQELFLRHPVIGNGFANFAELLSHKTNVGNVYAHNNYWEILADLGILGFISYYWFYVLIIVKLATGIIKNRFNNLLLISATMIVVQIILEWGVVSMQYLSAQTVIALVYVCAVQGNVSSDRLYYYNQKKDEGE